MAKDFTSQAGGFMQAEAEKKAKETAKPKTKKITPNKKLLQEAGKTDKVEIPAGYVLKPEGKSKRLNLLISPTLYESVKAAAQAQGISVNAYINETLQREVSK